MNNHPASPEKENNTSIRDAGSGLLFLSLISLAYLIPIQTIIGTGTAYILYYTALTICMVWIWFFKKLNFSALLLIGVIARIILLPAPFITSNDAERYLWDGAVFLSGFDPYLTSPNDLNGLDIRDQWSTPPEHSPYATIYPPGAITLFSLSALAGPVYGVWAWKALITLASILSVFIMGALVKQKGLHRHFAFFALSPLLILETGVGGHLDSFLVLSVVSALWALSNHKLKLAGLVIGLGSVVKFLPLLLLWPILLSRSLRHSLQVGITAGGVILAFYGLFLSKGIVPIGVIPVFLEKWRGGAPLFTALEALLPGHFLVAALVLIASALFILASRLALRGQVIMSMMVSLAIPLIISPIVFPWYLSILIPFLTLRPSLTLLIWTSTLPLTYEVLDQWLGSKIWELASWPIFVIAGSVLMALIVDIMRDTLQIKAPCTTGKKNFKTPA